MTQIFLDVETTGLNPVRDSIIQMSGLVRKDGQDVESFNWYLKPYKEGIITPALATKLRTTQEQAESFPDQSIAFCKFCDMLTRNGIDENNKAFICGYNTKFDVDFLNALFQYNQNFRMWYLFYTPVQDVMSVAAFALARIRPFMRNFKLTTVYETVFKESFFDAHDAMSDIKATIRLWDFLNEQLLPPIEVPEEKVKKT